MISRPTVYNLKPLQVTFFGETIVVHACPVVTEIPEKAYPFCSASSVFTQNVVENKVMTTK